MRKDEILKNIMNIEKISEELLEKGQEVEDRELEKYFCKLERARMEMYDEVERRNGYLWFEEEKQTESINNEYTAIVKNGILKIHIPEKIPPIKQGLNYVQKRIAYNISRIVRGCEGLFFNEYVMIIVKIYDNGKIWDVDNRNVKPIHDGLVHGQVIRDDNIYCSCYMVQGYYSDKPCAEVCVIPASEIIQKINKDLR